MESLSSLFNFLVDIDPSKVQKSLIGGGVHSFLFNYLCPTVAGGRIPPVTAIGFSVGLIFFGIGLSRWMESVAPNEMILKGTYLRMATIGLLAVLVDWAPYIPNLPVCNEYQYQYQFSLPAIVWILDFAGFA